MLGNITVWRVPKKSPNKKIDKEKFFSIDSPIDSLIQYNDRIWIGSKDKITVVDASVKVFILFLFFILNMNNEK